MSNQTNPEEMKTYIIILAFADGTDTKAEVKVETLADACMIARGWLRTTSLGEHVTISNKKREVMQEYYNVNGFIEAV